MDGEKIKRIQEFLTKNETSIDTISKSKLEYLEKADDAIQSRLTLINTAKGTLKNTVINVSNVAKDTEISRKTFYNNDLLRLYVESFSTDDSNKNITSAEYEKIKEKNNILNKQVNDFILRDIETENLRHENSMLYKEIMNLKSRNESLEKKYEEIQKELSETKRKSAKTTGHIIHLKPKK